MKKKVAVLLSSVAALVGALALTPAAANAYVFAGSCAWPTNGNAFWSPANGRYIVYEGHTVIGGYWYRVFYAYPSATSPAVRMVVYCG